MKIGFSTADGKTINTHFGHSESFDIYEINSKKYYKHMTRKVKIPENYRESSRIEARLNAISDCTILFITQIGPAAAARVTRSKIMPVKVNEGTEVIDQLDRLLIMLQNKPPLWLRKILNDSESLKEETL